MTRPKLDDRDARRVGCGGPLLPRFSFQRRWRAFSSFPMITRASEPPMKFHTIIRRFGHFAYSLFNLRIHTGYLTACAIVTSGIAPPFTEMVFFDHLNCPYIPSYDRKSISTERNQFQ